MYVLRSPQGYVRRDADDALFFGVPLAKAERFSSVVEAIAAVQRGQAHYDHMMGPQWYGIMSAQLSIERITTRVIPARAEETTEAL